MRHKLLTGVFVLSTAGTPAAATDWYTGAPASAQPKAFNPVASIDLSAAASHGSRHGVLQGTIGPFGGLEQTGLRVRLGGMLGTYVYQATTPGVGKVRGDQLGGTALLGYEWVIDRSKFSVYGGLDVIETNLDRVDPENKTPGTVFGFRGVLDFYSRPTTATMIAGTFSLSSANTAYYGRLKAGFSIFDHVYVGPEVLALGDTFYRQIRAGLHLSGLKIGPVEFGLSGGYAHDRVRGGGAYGLLDVRMTF